MQAIVWTDSSQGHSARVMPPSQIVTQSSIQVSVDIKDVAFTMLACFDDGFIGREGFAYSKARGSIAVSSDD